jgi:ATP-dependent DNA ligase
VQVSSDRRSVGARLARILKPRSARSAKAIAGNIQLSEAIVGKGEAMFREACRMGLEGIVSKRIGSRYVSGRTRAWLKVKNPAFVQPPQE